MARPKLAPPRKRRRRVARKIADRFGLAHHRDVPGSLHCLYCSPVPVLDGWPDDAQLLLEEELTRSGHLRGLASPERTPCWAPHLWAPTMLTPEPLDYSEPPQPLMVLSPEALADLLREIMDTPNEPAPDTILLPDTPNARAAAAMIDELNAQHGSPKWSRVVDLEMTAGGVRVFRPETVKRIDE